MSNYSSGKRTDGAGTKLENGGYAIILVLVVLMVLFLSYGTSPSCSASIDEENPYNCLSQSYHLSVTVRTLESTPIHPPLFDQETNETCFQCHVDSQLLFSSASLSRSSLAQKARTLVEEGGKTDEIQKDLEEFLNGSQSLEEGFEWFKTARADV